MTGLQLFYHVCVIQECSTTMDFNCSRKCHTCENGTPLANVPCRYNTSSNIFHSAHSTSIFKMSTHVTPMLCMARANVVKFDPALPSSASLVTPFGWNVTPSVSTTCNKHAGFFTQHTAVAKQSCPTEPRSQGRLCSQRDQYRTHSYQGAGGGRGSVHSHYDFRDVMLKSCTSEAPGHITQAGVHSY